MMLIKIGDGTWVVNGNYSPGEIGRLWIEIIEQNVLDKYLVLFHTNLDSFYFWREVKNG